MLGELERDFAELPGTLEIVECAGNPPDGEEAAFPRHALRVRREGAVARKTVLLNGHYDTVYGAEDSFQTVDPPRDGWMRGPGVTDMKGGLLVLLETLRRWEQSEDREALSWEVLLTPDEEIGSPFSIPLLQESAARCDVGMIYESSYPDGGFVRSRMGSGTYTVSATGRAAHVGRNFYEGVNAVTALCRLAVAIEEAAERIGIIANIGHFEGGGPLNVVPASARLRINARAPALDVFAAFEHELDRLTGETQGGAVASFAWRGGVSRPPKTVNAATQALYDTVSQCAERLGQSVLWRDTGGGSDGSNLAAYGLPNIDNLGVCGRAIHSPEESVDLASIEPRIALSLEILKSLARS